MSLEKLIESQIQDAIAAGAFDNLPGAGQPLPHHSDAEKLAGENWLGFKVLQNGGLVPEWLGLGREIELDLQGLAVLEERYHSLLEAPTRELEPDAHRRAIDYTFGQYETLAREIRRKQDNFNLKAPGHLSQRPGLWVEYHLARLREAHERAIAGTQEAEGE